MELNHKKAKRSPIDDIAEWYANNGVKQAKPSEDWNKVIMEKIERGETDGVTPFMKIAYGFDQLEKERAAKREAENNEA